MRGGWLLVMVACHAATPATEPSERVAVEPTKPARAGRIVVTDTDIEYLEPIAFLPGSATIDPRSVRTLDAVAQTLNGNPSLLLIGVHAEAGDALAQFQQRLAADRADVVIAQLVARGVPRVRLVPDPGPGSGARIAFLVLQRKD